MDFDSCFQLGYIIKSRGLEGEVSVFLDTDQPESYRELESVFVEQNKKLVPFFIDKTRISASKAVFRFEGISDIDQANSLQGAGLWLPLTVLPELSGNDFYYHEIEGFALEDKIHGNIGTVKTVYTSAKQDLIAADYKGVEILIPISRNIINKVDKSVKTIYTNLPDGLLEVYYSPDDED
jgi:16S rRNA processing protein RimM